MHHKNFHILNYKIIFVNVCIMVGIAWRAASWTELIPSRKHSLLDIRRIFTIRTAGFPLWRKMGWELLKENKQEKKKENTFLTKKTIKKKKKVFLLFIGCFLGRVRVFFLFSWPLSAFFSFFFSGRFLCPTSNERADKVISRGRLA